MAGLTRLSQSATPGVAYAPFTAKSGIPSVPCVVTDFQSVIDLDVSEVFLQEFAVDAKYVTYLGIVFDITGIYDDEYTEVDPDTNMTVQSQGPRFRVDVNDLPPLGVHKGDKLSYCEKVYEVIRNEPDGTGINDLILHEVIE